MKQEIVLLLQEKISWENLIKIFGKDFFPLDETTEQIVVNPKKNDKVGDGRIYVKRHVGLIIASASRTKMVYDQGAMSFGGQEIEIKELVLTRMSGKQDEFLKQAVKVSKKFSCILESRSHEQRAVDTIDGTEFGRYHVKEFASRTLEDALKELMWWHLCGISQASAEFNLHSADRLPVRRLRVEIRKLRAVMAMLESAIHPDAAKWQERLRGYTIRLSRLRELDVALSAWKNTALNRKIYSKESDKLAVYFAKERDAEEAKIKPDFALTSFTPFLLQLMIWIVNDPVREGKQMLLLDKMAHKKLGRWYDRMQQSAEENPEFANDQLAHEMRIKAKAMRYVMQSMSGKAYGDENKIMRSLKKLLDALGILHDNWVNEELAKTTMKKRPDNVTIYLAGIFTGNERAQALRIRKMLPDLWERFSADWEKWY